MSESAHLPKETFMPFIPVYAKLTQTFSLFRNKTILLYLKATDYFVIWHTDNCYLMLQRSFRDYSRQTNLKYSLCNCSNFLN